MNRRCLSQTDRQAETETDKQRDKEAKRKTFEQLISADFFVSQIRRERERERDRDRDRDRETETDKKRQRHIEREKLYSLGQRKKIRKNKAIQRNSEYIYLNLLPCLFSFEN